MYLKLSYGTTEYTTEFIINNSSCKLEEIYYNDLAHADNSCSVRIPFNVDIQNFINAYSDNSILAQIKNGNGTNIFTGYVRKNYDFSKAQKNQALSLELVSPSFLLDVDTTQDITLENTTLNSVVNALLADAKFSTATLASLSSYTISIFTLDEGSNVKTTLDNLLQQYGFTFDFDKDGNFYVATLFSDVPADKSTIAQIFDGTNSIDEIKVEKKEQEYNGVNLSWTEYKNISNKLIFADTTNGSASDNTCSIELEAGKFLTSGNDDDTGTSYYVAYDSSEGDIIYIDSATLVLESSNNNGLTYSFINLGKKGELSIYNKSSSTITITKINVNGSGYVAGSENQTKTTTGKKFKDITGDYIHDSTNAKKFAQNYCDWQNYADYKISLKSNSDFALGSFVKISEYGLGTLYGRIINKNYKLNSPIEYKIEAISEYEKAETTNYFTKNYKQGISGATGVGISSITEYYLASASSSGVSTSTTGWTTTIQTITTTKKYLWNYEKITYTDGTTSTTTPVVIGTYGDTGATGATGADGVSISSVTEYYLRSTASTGIVNTNTSFSTTVPTLTSTYKYLWNYELITYSDGTTFKTSAVMIGAYGDTGATGPQGEQGEPGVDGTDGKTSYFHVAYANSADGSIGFNQSSGTYIGTYVDYTATDSTSYSSYTWKKFVGDTGATGAKGVAGTNGTNGKTSYLHMAYANSSDGKTNFSVSYFTGAKYLGTYTDFTEADSTSYSSYTWAVLKGDTGAKGATGATGATGAKGADGTDSTAITISAPSSTTPESGMKYDNTYYGIYSGIWYKWSWSSTTTGAWTQVSADTPPTPSVRYSFDEMPDLPDDSGAIYKASNKSFTSTTYWSAENGSISLSDGCIVNTSTAPQFNSIFNKSVSIAGKVVKYYFKVSSSATRARIYYYNGATTAIASIAEIEAGRIYEISAFIPSDAANTSLRLNIVGAVSGTVETIYAFYIGDGTTSQPIIDNVSGAHNSTAQSGVVSTTGVSGKACQFLGYRAISLDLSAYANVQSWWTSRWITIGDVVSSINPRFWAFGPKDYAFRDGGTSSSSSNTINIFTYNGSNSLGGGVVIPSGSHFVVVQTTIASSSSATKKVYIDGVLTYTFTSTADFTFLAFASVCFIGGATRTRDVMSGSLDDFQFGVGEITASEVLGLYLQRASGAKMYTLADYNYDSSVSSWEITSSAASLSKSRAGVVTPSTVTFSAKAVIASVAQAYSGRFIIYTSTNGTTFSSVYTSSADESSHAYSPAANIVAIRVELYKSGGTSVLVATKDYSVPYDASVKPQYLGIGLIADVNGLTTKAFTGATITDTGVITPNGATTTAVIPGDWLINYSAGTYRALGIYYWSGSAWMITSDSKYTSDGVIEDICRLNNGGILIPDWTVYVNLIADNLFSHKIKLTTKTISGVTYEGVFYGGERFNADGSIADRTANGFYFQTDGKGWCNLQSDDLHNTIIGTDAGLRLISGSGGLGKYNSIYGMNAGYNLIRGYSNTINGAKAGYNLTIGNANTINGVSAGYNLTTGEANTINGMIAGYNLTTGCHCLFDGYDTYAYNPAWNYQINLNNRILYLEFASDATQDTVYKALAHYIVYSAGNVECVGAMGRYGATDILKIVNNGDNNIDFYSNEDDNKLAAESGSFAKINAPLQVAFIIPAEPTNK